MKTAVLRSSPLKPLAERMRKLATGCKSFWIATAFVSSNAVDDVLGVALDSGAHVRLLTGTFGNLTRKATFQRIHELKSKKKLQARVWDCGAHGNFHGKIYLWRMSRSQGVAWIGSANFTNGGLVNQGEIVLELRGTWNSGSMNKLQTVFEAEWALGGPLTEEFLHLYKEAARLPPDGNPIGGLRRSRKNNRARPSSYFAAFTDSHVEEGGSTDKRVRGLLDPTASRWVRHYSKELQAIRPRDEGFIVDKIESKVEHVVVTDTQLDGRAYIFSYERIGRPRGWNPNSLSALRHAGLQLRSNAKTLGMRWLSEEDGNTVLRTVFGPRPKK